MQTLEFLLSRSYAQPEPVIKLASCPHPGCGIPKIDFRFQAHNSCPKCKKGLLLIDYFRLQDLIDEDQGAHRALTYVFPLIEQLLLLHYLKFFNDHTPENLLPSTLFLRDGSLAFSGQTNRFSRPVRGFLNTLKSQSPVHFIGIEKSGRFADHAAELSRLSPEKIKSSQILVPDNDYINKYIPTNKAPSQVYGESTHYGANVIFRGRRGQINIVCLPTANSQQIEKLQKSDFENIDVILDVVDRLKCDLYDNAVLPIGIINQAVSLAHRPSAVILRQFVQHRTQSLDQTTTPTAETTASHNEDKGLA